MLVLLIRRDDVEILGGTTTCIAYGILCVAERNWLISTNIQLKIITRVFFFSTWTDFDREVQKCKKAYWIALQNELPSDCKNKYQELLWKTIAR